MTSLTIMKTYSSMLRYGFLFELLVLNLNEEKENKHHSP